MPNRLRIELKLLWPKPKRLQIKPKLLQIKPQIQQIKLKMQQIKPKMLQIKPKIHPIVKTVCVFAGLCASRIRPVIGAMDGKAAIRADFFIVVRRLC